MHIVTGGAGFIGSAVIWMLNEAGVDDILVVDNLGTSEKWKNLVNRRWCTYMHRDDFLRVVKEGSLGAVHSVVHMGACSATTERDADFLMRNNLEYSKTVCLFALDKGARFINASSAATYGDGSLGFDDAVAGLDALKPLNMYGYSKQLFDLWLRREGLLDKVASLKFFNVYGPNEQHKGDMRSVINKAFHTIGECGKMRLFRSTDPKYADGGQMRDFVYVKDCVAIIKWLLDTPHAGGIFNVGTGRARTWNDLLGAVFQAMGKPVDIEYVDMPEHLRGKYQNFTEARMERLRAAGWAAPMTDIETGVRDYIQNYLMAPDPYL